MWVGSIGFQWASTHQLGNTISDLMAKKRMGKTGGAAGDPSHARLHGATHDLSFIHPSIQQPGLLSRTWKEAVLEGRSWRQELYEGAIHWHGTQPAHGGCWTRLHVTITRHNQCVCTDINLLSLYPNHPHWHQSSFITGCSTICNTQLGSANKYE